MPARFRRPAALLLPLALLPLLAHADPLEALGYAAALAVVLGGVLLVLVTLTLVLVVLAYQRPARRGLYVAQLVLLALNALAGLVLLSVSQYLTKLLPLSVNPFWELVLPLGLWLNGIRWARQAREAGWRRGWVALAVVSLTLLLGLLPYQLLNAWVLRQYAAGGETLIQAVYIAVAALMACGSWVVVTRQLRLYVPAATWQPWWRLPLLAAALSTAHSLFSTWSRFAFVETIRLPATTYLRIGGQALLVSWVLGVLALLVLQPGRAAVQEPPAG